jgi:hypothetical protein
MREQAGEGKAETETFHEKIELQRDNWEELIDFTVFSHVINCRL